MRLVAIELQKLWRSRWVVFAVLFGLFALISVGLYAYYVYREHRASPPAATPWRTVVEDDIKNNEVTIQRLQEIKQQQPQGGGTIRSGPFGGSNLDSVIAERQQAIKDDRYLLDNGIAPVKSASITQAALFGLGGVIMFLLTRIFGWLASEQVAGERSNRTIAILLSRPASRDQVLAAKAAASFLISLAVVVVTFLIVYAVFAFVFGSAGPITDRIGISVDGSKPLSADNLVALPIPVFVLMCLGASMLAILCVQAMSLLISVLSGRSAVAIGVTLAVLFAAPIVSGIVGGIITLISGSASSADFLKYVFFNDLAPVDAIALSVGSVGNAAGKGMSEFGKEVGILALWTAAFFAVAWGLFHRKQEAG